jgi:hypothetical protein
LKSGELVLLQKTDFLATGAGKPPLYTSRRSEAKFPQRPPIGGLPLRHLRSSE